MDSEEGKTFGHVVERKWQAFQYGDQEGLTVRDGDQGQLRYILSTTKSTGIYDMASLHYGMSCKEISYGRCRHWRVTAFFLTPEIVK